MKSVLFTGSSGQLGFACKEIFPSKLILCLHQKMLKMNRAF